MAWTAGVTRTTGDLISAGDWNNYLGASGSLDYLKSASDTNASDITTIENQLNDCSHAEPARAFDTIYQNSTKIRIVTVAMLCNAVGEGVKGLIGSGTPPGTIVLYSGGDTPNIDLILTFTFVVPASWYYKVEVTAGTPVKQEWHEWDLL